MRHLFAMSALVMALTGCASNEPTFGSLLGERSDQADEISRQWNKGAADVQKGKDMIKKGNKLIEEARKSDEKGRDLISEGQRVIEKGKKQISQSEAAYRDLTSNPLPTPAAEK